MAPAKSSRLEDQAATAALYVTKGKNQKQSKETYPLDADGKLSSASAATSLKHAEARDLPAFPVVGVDDPEASADKAAHLANAHPKKIEFWKPGEIPAASKAAHLAKDVTVDPIYEPELSSAGSKAALIAAKDVDDVKIWRPRTTDAGLSAAGQAMRGKTTSPPTMSRQQQKDIEKKALMAASGAMSGNRRRAGSTPTPSDSYPDASRSSANALKAATSANRAPPKVEAPVGHTYAPPNMGQIHTSAVTNMSREMYTSHPPVSTEVDEKARESGLRAAAVSMAKKMYDVQQKQTEQAAASRHAQQEGAIAATQRPPSSTSSNDPPGPRYNNLQEAAQKLAAERLAKLHDEHAAYRNYYGMEKAQNRKLSIRGRRRASSEGQTGDSDDESKSRQIRNQMSMFSDKLAQVDKQKRQQDRKSLLEVAQRNVRASMQAQDTKVFNETGKITPAMMAEWEAKAKAKAEEDSKARMVNHGLVHIGGGKFLEQSEVDAIAAEKVQPTLDDIHETAEKHRARDEELRQQQLERERITAEKAADTQERKTRSKEEWKKFKEEEKREERARKDAAKEKKAEERRRKQEEKRKSKEPKATGAADIVVPESKEDDKEPIEIDEEYTGAADEDEAEEAEPTQTEAVKDATETPAQESIEKYTTAQTEETAPSAADAVEGQKLAEATQGVPQETSKPDTSTEGAKPGEPLESRISPPAAASIAANTYEANVTSGSPSTSPRSKDKESGKGVSSWLKTKLSRNKPTNHSDLKEKISEPRDPKVFVGGADMGAPDGTIAKYASTSSSDPRATESSMRDVALAGKNAGPVDGPVVSPSSEVDKQIKEGEPSASKEEGDDDGDSLVSSLSSDEDTRGRSQLRMADAIEQHRQAQLQSEGSQPEGSHPKSSEATHGATTLQEKEEQIKPETETEPAIFGSTAAIHKNEPRKSGDDPRASMGTDAEDFQEAQDTIPENQDEEEELKPPDKGKILGTQEEGRKSDSPARDSKFVEVL